MPTDGEDDFHPETLTTESLLAFFKSAYLQVSIDPDGDLMLQETFRSWIRPTDNGEWLRLFSQFVAKEGAPLEKKLAYVNRVNADLRLPRAYVNANGSFTFEHYVSIAGGLPRQSLMTVIRKFQDSLHQAVRLDHEDVLG